MRGLYERCCGSRPAAVARAPGRVELLGNHTDYNEGYVLSAAIDRALWVAAGRSRTHDIELCSAELGRAVVSAEAEAPLPAELWARYPVGIYRTMKQAGVAVAPVCLAIASDVPVGVGLSSSGALTVACALALSALFDGPTEALTLARLCQEAEQELVGTQCGLLDPLTCLRGETGQLLLFDFRCLEHRTVAFPSARARLAITISDQSRRLADGAYNDCRADCAAAAAVLAQLHPHAQSLRDVSRAQLEAAERSLDPVRFRRARHVIGENERVLAAAHLLGSGDLAGCGRLLDASHESSRFDFGNSSPELDTLVEIARGLDGVYGSRLTGGGFGGAIVTLLDPAQASIFAQAMAREYLHETGRRATVFCTVPAAGARLVAG